MSEQSEWYRQALYEQAWENYRNEDDNYRSTITQYLVFTATMVYAAAEAHSATRAIGFLGLFISIVTVFYLGRITRYSLRWLIAKDHALDDATAIGERGFMNEAGEILKPLARVTALVPGFVLTFAIPISGGVFFALMISSGTDFWQ